MLGFRGLFRHITRHKDWFAVAFSSAALIFSGAKAVVDFVVPVDVLSVIISPPKVGSADEGNPLPISRGDDKKLRLDPELHVSFINSSPGTMLIRTIDLVSPVAKRTKSLDTNACQADVAHSMNMYKFRLSGGEERDAEPFAITTGDAVPMNIRFAGIADIESSAADGVNISRSIPICLEIEAFDQKARRHFFSVRIFDITSGSEVSTTYTNRLQDKNGLVAVRYSALWSIFH
jgi:hypothetical protein